MHVCMQRNPPLLNIPVVRMHECMYVCMNLSMYVPCMHGWLYACMHVCMCAWNVCVHACMHVCMQRNPPLLNIPVVRMHE